MPEGDDLPGTSVTSVNKIKKEKEEDLECIASYPENIRNSDEFKKLTLLKRIKRDKEKKTNPKQFKHVGYKVFKKKNSHVYFSGVLNIIS